MTTATKTVSLDDVLWYFAKLVLHDLHHLDASIDDTTACPCCVAKALADFGLLNFAEKVSTIGDSE
jgi:hypothetical protein